MIPPMTISDDNFQVTTLNDVPLIKMPSTLSHNEINDFEIILRKVALTHLQSVILDFADTIDIHNLTYLDCDCLRNFLTHLIDQGVEIFVWSAQQPVIAQLHELNLHSLLSFDDGTDSLVAEPYIKDNILSWSFVRKKIFKS
jgi:anti-anti-sigma regulatory factor